MEKLGFLMLLALGAVMWGHIMWLVSTSEGTRTLEANRANIGNCWPVCPPIPEGYEVSRTIVKKED